MPQRIAAKVYRKAANKAFKFFLGLDRVALAKIHKRSDLHEIGSKYGGWVIPMNLLNSDAICYCVGCGEDISFDLGLIDEIGCNVFAFDPTPRAIKHVEKVAGEKPGYHFSGIGLWNQKDTLRFYVPKNSEHVSHSLLNLQKTEDYISVNVDRLSALMQERGHDRIDLLKIDIEGAEYKVIQSILEDKIDVRVLCVEYDEYFSPLDKRYLQRIRASVNSLLGNGYSLVYSQGNGNYTFVKDT